MKVIICGAGQVGWQLARYLSRENNDVTVVDYNSDLVRRATDTLDVQGINGFASYPDVLDRAGAADADMIIAATHSDEVNMVTCQIAHSVFDVRRKIARIRSQNYLEVIYSDLYRTDHMPIDEVISPEMEVAASALSRLEDPAAFETEDFFDGKVKLMGLTIGEDCPVVDTPLRQLTELFSTLSAIVVGIRRKGALFAPSAGDQIFVGDAVYVMARADDVDRTMEVFGKRNVSSERVVIIGGGNVGLRVAQSLEEGKRRVRVRMIERDRAVAERAADSLQHTIVLNGDGVDPQLLSEARVDKADAVLCVTDDDRANMLVAVRAKQMGAKMAICLTNDPSLEPLMEPLGIDANINPRATTVSSILRYLRHSQIFEAYSIGDAEAEVVEGRVVSTSPMTGQMIRDMDIPDGIIIGAILRGDKVIKPHASTRVEEGDNVAIFAIGGLVQEVEALFNVGVFYI